MDQCNYNEMKCNKLISEPATSDIAVPVKTQTSRMAENRNMQLKFASMTPEKENDVQKYRKEILDIPEKYKITADLFDSMVTSLRLLSLCKKAPTFENINTQVNIFTKREFSCKHLSQIVHTVPEAIFVDKILIHDKRTLCMKPEMKVTLKLDLTEGHNEPSSFLALRKIFISRLVESPEGFEIPEALLPEPFARVNQGNVPETCPSSRMVTLPLSSPDKMEVKLLSEAQHITPSPGRHFSEKAITNEMNIEEQSILPSETAVHGPPISPDLNISSDKLMVDTPALLPPTRLIPTCDDKLKLSSTKKHSSPHAKRSLDFSDLEEDQSASYSNKDKCKIVSLIFHIFQSLNFVAITKEELLHKIIMEDFVVMNRREVEEQLHVLEKVVPDWICRIPTCSGDILYKIVEVCDLKHVEDSISASFKTVM